MKNVKLRLSAKNLWDAETPGKSGENFYMAICGETYDNKDEIKTFGFKWNGINWVKRIVATNENIVELAELVKSVVESGAEFESLISGGGYNEIMENAGIEFEPLKTAAEKDMADRIARANKERAEMSKNLLDENGEEIIPEAVETVEETKENSKIKVRVADAWKMTKKDLFKKAHEITKQIKAHSPEVDYRAQFGEILKELYAMKTCIPPENRLAAVLRDIFVTEFVV